MENLHVHLIHTFLCYVCRTENILNAVREFVVSAYQDFLVVWPGLLM